MNENIFEILQSPDDGTSLNELFQSETGIEYEVTPDGILMLQGGGYFPKF